MFGFLRRKTRDHGRMARDMRRSLKDGDFRIVYQPIIDSKGETMVGVEALCRWRHPVRGETQPSAFIAIAEESGLIDQLGLFVLRQACLDARNWPGVIVSVNVSPRQFEAERFPDAVLKILAETGLEPSRLELELTENLAVVDLDRARAKMLVLQNHGVRIALDDFGSGHSSLNYLLSLPFDKLKVDRMFVSRIESGAASAVIIHAIVSIGRALGMHITAEGVETAEQQQFLRSAGVHSFQGFRFSRPVDASEILSRLQAQKALAELLPATPPLDALGVP